ncbi:MAG: hypothetical protein JNM56_12705 [Planctomycetia bacterium]|nr:hypothetical protein [Planctomycetia bacterium]
MDAKSIPVLTVAWWKKNKDLTAGGEIMTKALQSYEKAKADCDKEPSRDGYKHLVETLDLIPDAATAQASKLNTTLRGGMIAGLKNYGPVVKKAIAEVQVKNKAYLNQLANLLEEYQKVDKLLENTNSSSMVERGKAEQMMHTFDRACSHGKGRQAKSNMERQLETLKELYQTARLIEKKHSELEQLHRNFAKVDVQAVVGVLSFQMHEKREKFEKSCLKDIEALRKTINSKSDQELDRGGPEYQKKVQEYTKAMGLIVNDAEKLAEEVGKSVQTVNKFTLDTKDLGKKIEQYDTLFKQYMQRADDVMEKARKLLPLARDLDAEDTVEIDKRQRLLSPTHQKINQACTGMREKMQGLLKDQRELAKAKELEEQHYELVLKSFNQVVDELEEQTNSWAQKLPAQAEEADRHIKVMKTTKFNKQQATNIYNILDTIYRSSLEIRRQLETQIKKIPELHKNDRQAQTQKLAKLLKSIDETAQGALGRMQTLAPAIA